MIIFHEILDSAGGLRTVAIERKRIIELIEWREGATKVYYTDGNKQQYRIVQGCVLELTRKIDQWDNRI